MDGGVLHAMTKDLQELWSENVTLKEKINNMCPFAKSSFEWNDEKVKFYTGLPWFSNAYNII